MASLNLEQRVQSFEQALADPRIREIAGLYNRLSLGSQSEDMNNDVCTLKQETRLTTLTITIGPEASGRYV